MAKKQTPLRKIYISGRITGIEADAPRLFYNAEMHLKKLGFDVINPMTIKHNHNKSWANYMKADLKELLDCDVIYMLNNWQYSKGATIEKALAETLELQVLYEEY
jgi:hypothetical protein